MDHLSAGDSCCGPEAESVRGHPCLPVCGGPALSPADLELPLPLAATVAPEPGSGPGTRFVDLEPHPPKHASDPT